MLAKTWGEEEEEERKRKKRDGRWEEKRLQQRAEVEGRTGEQSETLIAKVIMRLDQIEVSLSMGVLLM